MKISSYYCVQQLSLSLLSLFIIIILIITTTFVKAQQQPPPGYTTKGGAQHLQCGFNNKLEFDSIFFTGLPQGNLQLFPNSGFDNCDIIIRNIIFNQFGRIQIGSTTGSSAAFRNVSIIIENVHCNENDSANSCVEFISRIENSRKIEIRNVSRNIQFSSTTVTQAQVFRVVAFDSDLIKNASSVVLDGISATGSINVRTSSPQHDAALMLVTVASLFNDLPESFSFVLQNSFIRNFLVESQSGSTLMQVLSIQNSFVARSSREYPEAASFIVDNISIEHAHLRSLSSSSTATPFSSLEVIKFQNADQSTALVLKNFTFFSFTNIRVFNVSAVPQGYDLSSSSQLLASSSVPEDMSSFNGPSLPSSFVFKILFFVHTPLLSEIHTDLYLWNTSSFSSSSSSSSSSFVFAVQNISIDTVTASSRGIAMDMTLFTLPDVASNTTRRSIYDDDDDGSDTLFPGGGATASSIAPRASFNHFLFDSISVSNIIMFSFSPVVNTIAAPKVRNIVATPFGSSDGMYLVFALRGRFQMTRIKFDSIALACRHPQNHGEVTLVPGVIFRNPVHFIRLVGADDEDYSKQPNADVIGFIFENFTVTNVNVVSKYTVDVLCMVLHGAAGIRDYQNELYNRDRLLQVQSSSYRQNNNGNNQADIMIKLIARLIESSLSGPSSSLSIFVLSKFTFSSFKILLDYSAKRDNTRAIHVKPVIVSNFPVFTGGALDPAPPNITFPLQGFQSVIVSGFEVTNWRMYNENKTLTPRISVMHLFQLGARINATGVLNGVPLLPASRSAESSTNSISFSNITLRCVFFDHVGGGTTSMVYFMFQVGGYHQLLFEHMEVTDVTFETELLNAAQYVFCVEWSRSQNGDDAEEVSRPVFVDDAVSRNATTLPSVLIQSSSFLPSPQRANENAEFSANSEFPSTTNDILQPNIASSITTYIKRSVIYRNIHMDKLSVHLITSGSSTSIIDICVLRMTRGIQGYHEVIFENVNATNINVTGAAAYTADRIDRVQTGIDLIRLDEGDTATCYSSNASLDLPYFSSSSPSSSSSLLLSTRFVLRNLTVSGVDAFSLGAAEATIFKTCGINNFANFIAENVRIEHVRLRSSYGEADTKILQLTGVTCPGLLPMVTAMANRQFEENNNNQNKNSNQISTLLPLSSTQLSLTSFIVRNSYIRNSSATHMIRANDDEFAASTIYIVRLSNCDLQGVLYVLFEDLDIDLISLVADYNRTYAMSSELAAKTKISIKAESTNPLRVTCLLQDDVSRGVTISSISPTSSSTTTTSTFSVVIIRKLSLNNFRIFCSLLVTRISLVSGPAFRDTRIIRVSDLRMILMYGSDPRVATLPSSSSASEQKQQPGFISFALGMANAACVLSFPAQSTTDFTNSALEFHNLSIKLVPYDDSVFVEAQVAAVPFKMLHVENRYTEPYRLDVSPYQSVIRNMGYQNRDVILRSLHMEFVTDEFAQKSLGLFWGANDNTPLNNGLAFSINLVSQVISVDIFLEGLNPSTAPQRLENSTLSVIKSSSSTSSFSLLSSSALVPTSISAFEYVPRPFHVFLLPTCNEFTYLLRDVHVNVDIDEENRLVCPSAASCSFLRFSSDSDTCGTIIVDARNSLEIANSPTTINSNLPSSFISIFDPTIDRGGTRSGKVSSMQQSLNSFIFKGGNSIIYRPSLSSSSSTNSIFLSFYNDLFSRADNTFTSNSDLRDSAWIFNCSSSSSSQFSLLASEGVKNFLKVYDAPNFYPSHNYDNNEDDNADASQLLYKTARVSYPYFSPACGFSHTLTRPLTKTSSLSQKTESKTITRAQPPTPAPPVVSELRKSAATTAQTSAGIQALASAGLVSMGVRTRNVLRGANQIKDGDCSIFTSNDDDSTNNKNDDKIEDMFKGDHSSAPFQISISGNYAIGTMIGNVVFVGVMWMLFITVYVAYTKIFNSKSSTTAKDNIITFKSALINSKSLHSLLFATLLVYGPLIEVTFAILVAPTSVISILWKVLGAILVLLIINVVLFGYWIFYKSLYENELMKTVQVAPILGQSQQQTSTNNNNNNNYNKLISSSPALLVYRPAFVSSIDQIRTDGVWCFLTPLKRLYMFLMDAEGEWMLKRNSNFMGATSNGKKNKNHQQLTEQHKFLIGCLEPLLEPYSIRFPRFLIVDVLVIFFLAFASFIGELADSCTAQAIVMILTLALYIFVTLIYRPNVELLMRICVPLFAAFDLTLLVFAVVGIGEEFFGQLQVFVVAAQLVVTVFAFVAFAIPVLQMVVRLVVRTTRNRKAKQKTKNSKNHKSDVEHHGGGGNRRRLDDTFGEELLLSGDNNNNDEEELAQFSDSFVRGQRHQVRNKNHKNNSNANIHSSSTEDELLESRKRATTSHESKRRSSRSSRQQESDTTSTRSRRNTEHHHDHLSTPSNQKDRSSSSRSGVQERRVSSNSASKNSNHHHRQQRQSIVNDGKANDNHHDDHHRRRPPSSSRLKNDHNSNVRDDLRRKDFSSSSPGHHHHHHHYDAERRMNRPHDNNNPQLLKTSASSSFSPPRTASGEKQPRQMRNRNIDDVQEKEYNTAKRRPKLAKKKPPALQIYDDSMI